MKKLLLIPFIGLLSGCISYYYPAPVVTTDDVHYAESTTDDVVYSAEDPDYYDYSGGYSNVFVSSYYPYWSMDYFYLGSGYHGLSHHGNDPNMIQDLVAIETAHIHCFHGFLKQLKEKKNAEDKSLLDDTVILLGTGMGDASRHSNRNLPTLVAGGGFKHQGHIAIDETKKDAPLLGDLYVTLMQKLGMEADSFSNATHNTNQLFF